MLNLPQTSWLLYTSISDVSDKDLGVGGLGKRWELMPVAAIVFDGVFAAKCM